MNDTPTATYLFIGGPWHGQRRTVPTIATTVASDTSPDRYIRRIMEDKRGDAHTVYCLEGLGEASLIVLARHHLRPTD